MRVVRIEGDLGEYHVRQLWDAVATADPGEALTIILDGCTGAQPWAMYAAAAAVEAYPFNVTTFVRGECMSAALHLLPGNHVVAEGNARFLPHGADSSSAAGQRRNAWQASRLARSSNLSIEDWLAMLVSAHHKWYTSQQMQEWGLVDEVVEPGAWT